MKKIILVFLALVSLFYVSCSNERLSGIKRDRIKVGFVYNGSIENDGYTKSHDLARIKLERNGVETLFVENVPENELAAVAMRELISQGCSMIFAISYGYGESVRQVSKEYPNVKFEHCSGSYTSDNVSVYFGRMYEARYLCGIVAGMKTSKNRIGYVAAYPVSECIRGINAFALGVRSVNPDARVYVNWTNSWSDPEKESLVASELLNSGCDVLAQHQNTNATQIEAEIYGAYSIGYNEHTGKSVSKSCLTSAVFDWSVYVEDEVNKLIEGSWKSQKFWEGMSRGVVRIDDLSDICASGTDKKVLKARGLIEDGSLHVFQGPLYDEAKVLRVPDKVIMTDEEIWNMDWFVDSVSTLY